MNSVTGVKIELSVVLGRAQMPVHQLLKMGRGAVIELDAQQTDPVLILANNKHIANGLIIVKDELICVEILDTPVGVAD